jgi:hypothetical protein
MGLGNGDVHKTSTQVCALKNMIIIHVVFKKKIKWISPYTHYSMKKSHTTHKNACVYVLILCLPWLNTNCQNNSINK